jgi:Tfp pilus assembly protein PilV
MRQTSHAGSNEPTGRPDRRSPLRGHRRPPRLRGEAGFTLFETLIAAVVLVIGLTTLLGLLDTSLKATAATRAREGATNLARQVLEDVREISYAQLSPSSITTELQERHGLSDASSAAGWQVIQRGITYTVTASECSIDDPKDGYGVHENSLKENPFCAESSTTGTADTQPEDLKRVTVDVTWVATGRKPKVHQVETLTAAGQAPGLNATGLRLASGSVYSGSATEPVITTQPASASLSFEVSAPSSTAAMKWSLEGVAQTPAPTFKSGTTWSFSWSIPLATVSDGTYEISAQAIDATGVVGPPVTLPVTLLRTTPAAVKGIVGGYNTVNVSSTPTKAVELEWSANTERNVIGYRIYNQNNALVCPGALTTLSVSLSCVDLSPLSTTAALKYTAYAVYRKFDGTLGQGAAATFTTATGPPIAPNAVAELKAKKEIDGSVHLEWPAVTKGQTVTFYRVYRGSTDYTSRYAAVQATGASPVTYTDSNATEEHKYWVTAVTANLTESEFTGPVTK